jgi:hypothetical protein
LKANTPTHAGTNDGNTLDKRLVNEFIGTLLSLDYQNQSISIAAGNPATADRNKASVFVLTPETKILKGVEPATLNDGIIGEEVRYGVRFSRQENKMLLTVLRFGPSSKDLERD